MTADRSTPVQRASEGVAVLGSTGSIGRNTLDVLARHPERFRVVALSAHSRVDALFEQCARFRPALAVVERDEDARTLSARLAAAGVDTQVQAGAQGLLAAAGSPDVAIVMAAIVGAAGLWPTLEAVRSGKRVLVANKEPLVMAGDLIMGEAAARGALLLPIDSEHNAIFQCLPYRRDAGGVLGHARLDDLGVRRILLTGSGGPFRVRPAGTFAGITPDEACAHPNWRMGRKISVDSATLMNKGLELIEACRLFGAEPARVEIVIHPQSVIHSMVEYLDGSVLAQLGQPDMRTPIAHALAWPDRIESGVESLDLVGLGRLDFEPPDPARFPCLRLAQQAVLAGGTAPTLLNAANEVAVGAFLEGAIPFTRIPEIIEATLGDLPAGGAATLEAILAADRAARDHARGLVRADA